MHSEHVAAVSLKVTYPCSVALFESLHVVGVLYIPLCILVLQASCRNALSLIIIACKIVDSR